MFFPDLLGKSPLAPMVKRLPTMWETQVRTLGWEDPLEKEMATHSSTLAWKIPGRGVAKSRAQPTDFTVTFTSLPLSWMLAVGLSYIPFGMFHV